VADQEILKGWGGRWCISLVVYFVANAHELYSFMWERWLVETKILKPMGAATSPRPWIHHWL